MYWIWVSLTVFWDSNSPRRVWRRLQSGTDQSLQSPLLSNTKESTSVRVGLGRKCTFIISLKDSFVLPLYIWQWPTEKAKACWTEGYSSSWEPVASSRLSRHASCYSKCTSQLAREGRKIKLDLKSEQYFAIYQVLWKAFGFLLNQSFTFCLL